MKNTVEKVLKLQFDLADPHEQVNYEAVARRLRWFELQTEERQNIFLADAVMRANAWFNINSWRINMLSWTRKYYAKDNKLAIKEQERIQLSHIVQGPPDADSKDEKLIMLKNIITTEDRIDAICILVAYFKWKHCWKTTEEILG